jgi:hypothetical protein
MDRFVDKFALYTNESVEKAFQVVKDQCNKMKWYEDVVEFANEVALEDAVHDAWLRMHATLSNRAEELLDMTPDKRSKRNLPRL